MKRTLLAVVIAFAVLSAGRASVVADPSELSSVMDKYVRATGGREVLSKIHTMHTVYKSTLLGHVIAVETTVKIPFFFLQVVQPMDSTAKMTFGFDGKTAWMQGADGVVHILHGEKRAEIISEAVGANGSEIFANRWPTVVTLKPAETINGKSYAVLSIKAKDGVTHDEFIDPETNMPVIERVVEENATSISVVEAFGKGPMGELQARIITTTRSDGPQVTSVLREAQDNAKVSNSIFAPPLSSKGASTI
ncbi:MAG TPA: hypothetical protein VGW96_02160 [Candidatus Eremiobacteraceae bacterium]|nr:hypothetical protein [Candidatus Eremiobacteraceae bacterium]